MLEHIVVAQIMDHLDHHKINHKKQHGFRSPHSCESQLLITTDEIVRSMNQSHQVDMAILDFAKKLLIKSHIKGFQGKWLPMVSRAPHSTGS